MIAVLEDVLRLLKHSSFRPKQFSLFHANAYIFAAHDGIWGLQKLRWGNENKKQPQQNDPTEKKILSQ